MAILVQDGARPHFSPSGEMIVFDKKTESGYFHVYLTDLKGHVNALTETRGELRARNNGNAIFAPSGKYIVFVSEEPQHFMRGAKWMADPGIGLFCNLWAMNREGTQFWQLTHIPIRRTLFQKLPVMGVVNPHFSPDGSKLVWTERYDKGGRWGRWRVQMADFSVSNRVPQLQNERNVVDAYPGNYVTAMGFVDDEDLLVAGNLEGQHEYGMDQYLVSLKTNKRVNLTKTPEVWEEGSCISPAHKRIVYMSNAASRYKLDFQNPNWSAQLIERDYWMMDSNGKDRERLTYFNDPAAPEYLGGRNIVAACDISRDGRYLAGTLGYDVGTETKANMVLKIVLMQFRKPL